jgi:hypothetical protein
MDKQQAIAPLPDPQPDPLLYRVIVFAVAAVAVLGIVGIITLAVMALPVPEALVAIGAAAVGYLGGVLSPTPRT